MKTSCLLSPRAADLFNLGQLPLQSHGPWLCRHLSSAALSTLFMSCSAPSPLIFRKSLSLASPLEEVYSGNHNSRLNGGHRGPWQQLCGARFHSSSADFSGNPHGLPSKTRCLWPVEFSTSFSEANRSKQWSCSILHASAKNTSAAMKDLAKSKNNIKQNQTNYYISDEQCWFEAVFGAGLLDLSWWQSQPRHKKMLTSHRLPYCEQHGGSQAHCLTSRQLAKQNN